MARLQIRLGVEQPRAAVDETAADVEQREQRDLAGLIGALGLTLFDLERRHDLVPPGADGLLCLLDSDRSRTARRRSPGALTAAY